MMKMKLLSVVTAPSIYHGCSTQKALWEEKFTGEENFTLGEFSSMNMKNCGRHNVRKHRDIKGSKKYVTLDISLKLDSLDNIRITSPESKFKWEISGKGLITSLSLKVKTRPNKYLKSRYAIRNVSEKDFSYESYEKKRHKNEPTDSYFYISRQLAKCMMRAYAIN